MRISVRYCEIHHLPQFNGGPCIQCATQSQRDVVNVLKAQVDDLSAENLDLRRRVSAIEHNYNRLAEQFNALQLQLAGEPRPQVDEVLL
jgi:hypothetical protein